MHTISHEQRRDLETGASKSQAPFIAESLRLLATVAASQGDDVVARALYEESLTITSEWDYRRYLASCLEALASVVEALGQPACAARLWEMAHFLYDSTGTLPLPVEQVACNHCGERDCATAQAEERTLLPEQALPALEPTPMSLPSRTTPPSTPPAKTSSRYPGGLTIREVEVLGLVARGLTDAQVAEQLVISPRTVNWHLTSIYSKLQVTSRSAATRYAIEHQLV